MKKPKLFIKNAKGRYEPYVVPEADVSDTLYRKVNGRYVPWEKELRVDHLTDGVWVVMRHRSSREYCNGQYLRECFTIDKASNLADIPLSGLGTMEQYCARVLHDLNEITGDDIHRLPPRDLVQEIVGLIFNYDKELKKQYAGTVEIPFGKKPPLWLRKKMENKNTDNGK